MERKIGEIFEYNGEWYQCVENPTFSCKHCDFYDNKHDLCNISQQNCLCGEISDKKNVIFKKLEKVGEPYSDYCPSGRIICFQRYKCYQKPIYTGNFICWADDINISIEIKQTKEDMEEKKLNLKPFDIQKAREGKPVCTRDGRKARIICFDAKCADRPIVTLVSRNDKEILLMYYRDGKLNDDKDSYADLMMLPEKKEGWINVYRDCDGANITKDDNIYSSKEAAIASAQIIDGNSYVATTKINWEE